MLASVSPHWSQAARPWSKGALNWMLGIYRYAVSRVSYGMRDVTMRTVTQGRNKRNQKDDDGVRKG